MRLDAGHGGTDGHLRDAALLGRDAQFRTGRLRDGRVWYGTEAVTDRPAQANQTADPSDVQPDEPSVRPIPHLLC